MNNVVNTVERMSDYVSLLITEGLGGKCLRRHLSVFDANQLLNGNVKIEEITLEEIEETFKSNVPGEHFRFYRFIENDDYGGLILQVSRVSLDIYRKGIEDCKDFDRCSRLLDVLGG